MTVSQKRRIRETEILGVLAKGGIMTAEQLWKLNVSGFRSGSVRNVHRVLREMENNREIISKRVDRKLYALPGSRFGFWEHRLALIDFLIKKKWFDIAQLEIPVKKNGEVILKADAGVNIMGKWHFVEVDRRQKLKENRCKVRRYSEIDIEYELWVVCFRERESFWRAHGVNIEFIN